MKRSKHSAQPAGRVSRTGHGEWIYGRHPVRELLRAARRHVYGLWLPEDRRRAEHPDIVEMWTFARQRSITVHPATRDVLERRFQGLNHQGVAVQCGAYPYGDFAQVLRRAADAPRPLVLILDHIEDPQNVGSLMRSAEAFGATAVVLPRDRAAGVTPAVARASAGAVEHLLVVRVVNLARAIESLREASDVKVWGLDMGEGAVNCETADLAAGVALVVRSEGRRLARLTRHRCDGLLRLPMMGRVDSLNAAVAGGIVLYETRRRQGSG